MAKQFGIQLVNPILHIFHCTKQAVINGELCSWSTFQMPLCQGGAGPELGSASLHCKMYWFLLTPSCCWPAKASQHLAVPHGASLVVGWQHPCGWLWSPLRLAALMRLAEVQLCWYWWFSSVVLVLDLARGTAGALYPSLGSLGWRQPNHLVLLEVLAKTLGRIVNGDTSQVKDVAGQVLAKAGLQKSWHLFPLVYGYTPCW